MSATTANENTPNDASILSLTKLKKKLSGHLDAIYDVHIERLNTQKTTSYTPQTGAGKPAKARVRQIKDITDEGGGLPVIPEENKPKFKFAEDGLFNFEHEITINKTDSDGDVVRKYTFTLDGLISGLEDAVENIGQGVDKEKSDEYQAAKGAWDAITAYLRGRNDNLSKALVQPFEELFQIRDIAEYKRYSEEHEQRFELAWIVMCKISLLATLPRVTHFIITDSWMDADDIDFINNPILFTFALRNIIARLAFHTVLNRAIYDVFRTRIEGEQDQKYSWKKNVDSPFKAFALVGFNRLLSPNNNLGASYSSDIDYKLVFDPDVIDFHSGEKKDMVKDFVDLLFRKQLEVKDRFDNEAGMLLEVEKFVTKDLDAVKGFLDTNNEAEINFLSTVFYNKVLITGSPSVYNKFHELLQDYKQKHEKDFIIAKRTWTQYLGETDKGSIVVIRYTKELKEFIDACAPKLVELIDQNLAVKEAKKATVYTLPQVFQKATGKYWYRLNDNEKRLWVANPHLLKKLFDFEWEGKGLASVLAPEIRKKKPPIFKTLEKSELLKRVAKVLYGLVDDDYIREKKLPESHLRNVVSACSVKLAETVEGNESLQKLFNDVVLKEFGASGRSWKDLTVTQDKVEWVSNPKVFQKLLTVGVAERLINTTDVKTWLKLAPLYNHRGVDLVATFMKVARDYAADQELIPLKYDPNFAATCLQQIGSKLVLFDKNGVLTSGWRFSLKYAGCRLNDFFDSVKTVEEYKMWWFSVTGKNADAGRIYPSANLIARALNNFALFMQNAVYLMATFPLKSGNWDEDDEEAPPKATHLQVDSFYARITRNQYHELVVRSNDENDVVDIKQAFRELKKELKEAKEYLEGKDIQRQPHKKKAGTVKADISSVLTQIPVESDDGVELVQAPADGVELFQALFKLSMSTALLLNPEK